ncbi:heat shock protein GrpE [Oceanococcus atlanticus]|uniref:Protein GrpE n=1 Tax=Oceanococcus atlanticus TaxID=1317117 RepID=A0A1Y1SBX3_9GAMM|nr:nucleotide exchange factor GrpE [Oceanococcus atlanticus]ORE86053.1 heat shock protein GrpE [Oceanococcus atlanticus]RZO86133.1 MAG: nucleotide exchange factor GrpE [Oceanococcus sp.]
MQQEPNANPDQPEGPDQTDNAADQNVSAAGEPSVDELKAQLAEAQAKADENWERCLRATAEQDNIRKRAEREVDAARRFALEKFAQDLLAVSDSLEMGLKAARDAGADEKYIEGTALTAKMFGDVLARHGVQVVDPKGESFDPARHEAMSAVPSAEVAPNTVIDVMQKGYVLNERVLRPAMVIVSRAVPTDGAA